MNGDASREEAICLLGKLIASHVAHHVARNDVLFFNNVRVSQ